jgi:hypothetical protein
LKTAVGTTIKSAAEQLETVAIERVRVESENLKQSVHDTVQVETEKLRQTVHERIDEHKTGVDRTISLSNENQRRWVKELATGLAQDKFNEEISRLRILWDIMKSIICGLLI